MKRVSLMGRLEAIEMARDYCLSEGLDPDEIVAGHFIDATGRQQCVQKARWRWYWSILDAPDDVGSIDPGVLDKADQ